MTPRSLPHHPSHGRIDGPLSTDLLVDIASGLATAHRHGALAQPATPTEGLARQRVLATWNYDVWVHAWAAGATADAHDHDGSVLVVQVLDGALAEEIDPLDADEPLTRVLNTGSVTELDALSSHGLRNPFPRPAVSIHVYSPPIGAHEHV